MGSRTDFRLWIAVAAAVFFSASGFSGTSVGLEGYSPGPLALLRFLVASFVLALYATLSRVRLPEARDFPALALAGFLAFSAFTVLLAYGQLTVPAGTASLLIATMPTWDRRGKCENVWHLTKKGFETVAESLGLDDERHVPKQLGQEGAVHHVKTAEVYVAAKADLDEILGPYPAWSWEHEKKAQDSYRYSGRLMGHQPDAHVRFADHLFVVERQTRESRIGPKAIDDKVSSHATYARVRLDEPDKVDVLFACDDKRVAELAERAGKRYGVDVIAGSVEHVAYYLYQSALRLAPEAGETVRLR